MNLKKTLPLLLFSVTIASCSQTNSNKNKQQLKATESPDTLKKQKTPFFAYVLRLTDKYKQDAAWTEEAVAVRNKHAGWLDSLGKAGTVIFVGRSLLGLTEIKLTDPRLFGIVVLRAANIEEAKKIMSADPARIYGTHIAEVMEFSMNMWYPDNYYK